MTTTQLGFNSFNCPSNSFLHTSQLAMKHQTNIRWSFPLRKDILYWIEAINLSPVSLFVKPFCLYRLFTTVYTQPRLSRWYIAFCNADSNHFLDFCITAKVVKIISNISAQLVLNTRPLVEFFTAQSYSIQWWKNWVTGQGGSGYQIVWILEKIPNSLRPAPPHFRKIMLQIFMTNMVEYMRGGMMAR